MSQTNKCHNCDYYFNDDELDELEDVGDIECSSCEKAIRLVRDEGTYLGACQKRLELMDF